jgi:citrate lyase subunit beta/citryl-CoA lyase
MSQLARWRSLLFVPANAQGLLARAHLRGADGVVLDLEDGVAPAHKEGARQDLPTALSSLASKEVDVLVRINVGWREALMDLAAAACAAVTALLVPKVEGAARLEVIAEMLLEFERERGLILGKIALIALIETPLGLAQATSIAAASRVIALALGPEDFCLSLEVAPTPEALEIPCRQLALAAATRGLQCLAMPISIAEIKDMVGFAAAADRAAAFGCTGALCVHPYQVKVANASFAPSAQALQYAESIVAEWNRAQGAGQAVTTLNGLMIDKPVAERAFRLLKQRSTQ